VRPVLAGSPAARVSGERVVIPADLLFNRGGTRLSEAGAARARELAQAIQGLPADRPWTIMVTGHADRQPPRRGSAFDNNREVALARAFNLTQALIEAGVPGGRLVAAGMGDERPLVQGNDPVAQALNRRIELELVPGR
jgi:chemotaxis protein MotB